MSILQDTRSVPSTISQANINHVWASLLIEELVRSGVRFFCISPGSRSTPLTTAVARHPLTRHRSHVDERGGAFMALGYGRATGRPAAWITTSGTAVANGLPAVVEAAADQVPLLLLTADRPPELRDTGANQTIDQVKIFGGHVRWQMDLPVPSTDVRPEMLLTSADQAVYRALHAPAGPVHLNCMFRKPLHPVDDHQSYEEYLSPLTNWQEQDRPYTAYSSLADGRSSGSGGETVNGHLATDWMSSKRGLVVAGRLHSAREQESVVRIAGKLGWPLLPDVTSGLRLGAPGSYENVVPYADQVLTSNALRESYQPEAVLHLGGRIISKRVRQFLKDSMPSEYVMLADHAGRLDPAHQVSQRWVGSLADLEALVPVRERQDEGWVSAWRRANGAVDGALREVEQDQHLSEPLLARVLTRELPAEHGLCLASSMPVRDVNRYGAGSRSPVHVIANRGASGIDGTVATAVGFAEGRETPVTLLIGDLALLHDLNALGLLNKTPVIVVVVNNDGGGIFHFLPIHNHDDVFEPFFGTPHGRSFEHAAAMFDLPYYQPGTPAEFVEAYRAACERGESALLEVITQREENRDVHCSLDETVAGAVNEAISPGRPVQ